MIGELVFSGDVVTILTIVLLVLLVLFILRRL